MTDPRAFTAHFGDRTYSGQIAALEGNRGQLRVRLEDQEPPGRAEGGWPEVGAEGELKMHDGARFRVGVLEALGGEAGACEYRLKLLGRG